MDRRLHKKGFGIGSNYRFWLASSAFVFALAGCGGGGGGSNGGGGTTKADVPHNIGGTVSVHPPVGGTLNAQGLVLSNTQNSDSLTLGSALTFTMPMSVMPGVNYSLAVTTQPEGQACSVTNASAVMPNKDVTTLSVDCVPLTYALGGTIEGLGNADGLVLSNGANDHTTITATSTDFTMSAKVAFSAPYHLEVAQNPAGLSCSVNQGEGVMPAASVATISVTCVPVFAAVYHFGSTVTDGYSPEGSVIQASDGNIYGVTYGGGEKGGGELFKVTLDGQKTVLHAFGLDGQTLYDGPIQASDGYLYGTTYSGGDYNKGVIYKIALDGQASVLWSFGLYDDAALPIAGLMQAADGNLYGTTSKGGAHDTGAVYKITPEGEETVVYSFGSSPQDGAHPMGKLIQANDGNFYGTTMDGGAYSKGVVFKLTPSGKETVLWSFGDTGDAAGPIGDLIQAANGDLYGMTPEGGDYNYGTIFSLTLAGAETVLHSFGNGSAGGLRPQGNLIQTSDGNFYGTTSEGGESLSGGTVFKMSAQGDLSLLWSFGANSEDGTYPYTGSLLEASDGYLYGLTVHDGIRHGGTLYKVKVN